MAIEVPVDDKQSFEVTIQGPDGANRMIICTGRLKAHLNADTITTGTVVTQKETFTALIDPQLEAGQFKRAVVVASLADIGIFHSNPITQNSVKWSIEQAQADFDDESGKVELRVSVAITIWGMSSADIYSISFQVTTIAAG